MRKAVFLLTVGMTLAACYSVPPAPTRPPATAGGSVLEGVELSLITKVNVERVKRGLPPLQNDVALTELAHERVRHHHGDLGFDLNSIGYEYTVARENTATTYFRDDRAIPAIFMARWTKKTLERDFTRMGVGVYRDAHGKVWGSLILARPDAR